jgi:hypothetical protein
MPQLGFQAKPRTEPGAGLACRCGRALRITLDRPAQQAVMTKSTARIAATDVFGLVAARTQHQTVEQRRIPAMANVMQFELLPRPACLTAVLGAQQCVAANDRTEFSAHAWLARSWPPCRPEAGDITPCSRILPSVDPACAGTALGGCVGFIYSSGSGSRIGAGSCSSSSTRPVPLQSGQSSPSPIQPRPLQRGQTFIASAFHVELVDPDGVARRMRCTSISAGTCAW